MTTFKKISGGLGLFSAGIAIAVLFQNCSAGSLPAGLDQTSGAPNVVAAAVNPLSMNPLTSTVVALQTVLIRVSGGSGTYTFTNDCNGGIVKDPLAGYIFTAPGTVPASGICTILVNDGAGQTKSAPVTITAAQTQTTTPTPTPTATSKIIYEFYDAGNKQHSYSDDPNFTGGQSYGPKYKVLTDGSTGAVPFYRCTMQSLGVNLFYSTTDPNCEGQPATKTQIGFVFSSPGQANTQPLYRYNINLPAFRAGIGVDHYDSLDRNPPAQFWSDDGIIAYVPTN